jgi:hypothetical protein
MTFIKVERLHFVISIFFLMNFSKSLMKHQFVLNHTIPETDIR